MLIESEYQNRVERAIATLQKDLPTLFERDIDYDIYTSDIEFNDPVNEFKGKFNYRIIFWTLRFHAGLFFTQIHFDVHRIEQVAKETIRVEWTVRGRLRLPWEANLFFNGDSTYTLTPQGLIQYHRDTWDRKPSEILKQFLPQRKSSI